jgi:hypothetical protein
MPSSARQTGPRTEKERRTTRKKARFMDDSEEKIRAGIRLARNNGANPLVYAARFFEDPSDGWKVLDFGV